ncbi:TldD/PmbA family protein [bacterium]|nr:TldD/PmbA family protein [bacterium]
MITQNLTKELFKIAAEKEMDFADVYAENTHSTSVICEENKIEYVSSGVDKGVGIRFITGEETLYASTNDFSPKKLKGLVVELCSSYEFKREKERGKKKCLDVFSYEHLNDENNKLNNIKKMPDNIPMEEKVQLVNLANNAARNIDSRIKQVKVIYNNIIKEVIVANSFGLYNCEKRVYTTFSVRAIAFDGKIIQTGSETIGGLVGFELFDNYNVEILSCRAAKRAVNLLSAPEVLAGNMPVILSSQAGGTMIHEAIGHSLEADLVQKGVSPAYAGRKGQKIGSELITVIDDPTLFSKRGSYLFDDEGIPARKNVLVENGVLKNYLYDLFSAWKDNTKSTGNGRRASYRFKPIPRMSNTYIASGKEDPQDIIKTQEKGLLVKKMGGGEVNTANGDFVFEVEEGYEIINGRVGALVRGATLIGNGPEVLNSIDKVGRDLGFNIGTCGKDGQGVPVSDGQPTLRIPKIIIGGTTKEKN